MNSGLCRFQEIEMASKKLKPMKERLAVKRKVAAQKDATAWLFGKERGHQHAVLACAKNGTISLVWTGRDGTNELIDGVWGFAEYHHRMLERAPEESKTVIVVVRSDGYSIAIDAEHIPKTRQLTALLLLEAEYF